MIRYLFFPAADRAQDEIWKYTAEAWNEDQADAYIQGLHRHLAEVANRPAIWRPLPKPLQDKLNGLPETFVTRYEHHLIFFKRLSGNRIGVISILHERMNLPDRLIKDLKALRD
jgi:plasmid stabilization system protein ParE